MCPHERQLDRLASVASTSRAVGECPLAAFLDILRSHGYVVDVIEADGAIHRARIEGDRTSRRNGWYVFHIDGVPRGAFGNWKTGHSQTWRSRRTKFTATQSKRLRAAWVECGRVRAVEHERAQRGAQDRAKQLWHEAHQPDPAHPYLAAKSVKAHGIRQLKNLLLIPMRSQDGELWAVQTIAPDGTKRFLRRARKRGLYHPFGGPIRDVLTVAEGYATGASVYEATGYPMAVAFDAGNLEAVATALRAKYPAVRLIVCADDDSATQERTGRNPGREYAERAARAADAIVVLPELVR